MQDDSSMSDIIFYLCRKNLEPNLISVAALHPAVSKLSQVFNNGLSMERIRLGMNDGVMTSYVGRPLTYIVTLPYSDLRTPAVMSQSPIY